MITLYLARHGQTVENLSRIFQGHLPGTLTEEGKKQAIIVFDMDTVGNLKKVMSGENIGTLVHN